MAYIPFLNNAYFSAKVGIGTDSPQMGLHVADTKGALFGPSGSGTASAYFSPTHENTLNGGYGLNTDTGDLWLNYRGYQDGFTKFRDTRIGNGKGSAIVMVEGSSGNVGIGTELPAQLLDVNGIADINSIIIGTNGDNMYHNGSDFYIKTETAHALIFRTSNTNRLTIESGGDAIFTGNVGIGTTGPTSALSINKSMGAAFIADFINPAVNGHGLLIQAGGTTGTRYITQWKDYAGTERFHMDDTGEAYFQNDVGIGNLLPSYKLDVSGTIRASGDVIAFSDVRVKENIKTIKSSLDKVSKLRGVEFNKIGEDEKSIGVIAQEIEKVIPEVVKTDDEGMKSVAYGNISGLLIEAIKELKAEVDLLKSKPCNCNCKK